MSDIQFTKVETGDMTDIPPDLPQGSWEATCTVKKSKTSKDGFPMLILTWQTDADLQGGNENFVGAKSSDFLVFFPERHAGSRMAKQKLKQLAEALKFEVPALTAIESWDDLEELISNLDGARGVIYTYVQADRRTGENRTVISYSAPRGSVAASEASSEASSEEKPSAKRLGPNGKPLKKKAAA